MPQPEDKARERTDRMLMLAGWSVQGPGEVNLSASRGVAIRNFSVKQGRGFADYLLYVDGRATGVIEAEFRFYFCFFIHAWSGLPKWKLRNCKELSWLG